MLIYERGQSVRTLVSLSIQRLMLQTKCKRQRETTGTRVRCQNKDATGPAGAAHPAGPLPSALNYMSSYPYAATWTVG